MGQKVHPFILRIGINKNWDSRWFIHKKEYAKCVFEDHSIRKFIKERLKFAAVSKNSPAGAGARIVLDQVVNNQRAALHYRNSAVLMMLDDRMRDQRRTAIQVYALPMLHRAVFQNGTGKVIPVRVQLGGNAGLGKP